MTTMDWLHLGLAGCCVFNIWMTVRDVRRNDEVKKQLDAYKKQHAFMYDAFKHMQKTLDSLSD